MYNSRIKNLEDVLAGQLAEHTQIIHVEEIDFLPEGANYASTMFRADITVKDGRTGKEEIIHTVAKMLPESEVSQELINTNVSVRKEIAFYNEIVPTLQNFANESGLSIGLDLFPKLYGGRLSLNNETVDGDSVILLENLIVSGYQNVDRHEGFNHETIKIILKDLSTFHAVTVAFKMKRSEDFEKKIRPHCFFEFGDIPINSSEDPPYYPLMEVLYQNDKCLPYANAANELFKYYFENFKRNEFNEAWGAIVHGDLWVNNLMVKIEEGIPLANKFVDFQIYTYDHIIRDLVFLLGSSVSQSILENSLDELLKYYHTNFVAILGKLECDPAPFSYQLFTAEVADIAREEIAHILFFILMSFAEKGAEHDSAGFFGSIKHLDLKAREKIWFLVIEWGRRGWI